MSSTEIRQLRCERIGEMRRFLVAQRCLQCVGLRVRRETQVLLDELTDFLDQRIETCAFFVDDRRAAHERHERAVGVFNADSRRAFATFDHHFDLAVLLFLRLENPAERSHPVNLFRSGLIDSGVVLSGQENRAIRRQRLFKSSDRSGTTYFESDFSKGKNHDVADWHHRIPGYVGGGSV